MAGLRYIVLVTDEDGSETAYGPWSDAQAKKLAANMAQAFPHAHVRALPLLRAESTEVV